LVPPSLSALDGGTRALVLLSATIASGDEAAVRRSLVDAHALCTTAHVEELILQSYLFCGFPRALNAMREWRRISPDRAASLDEADERDRSVEWQDRGERTCSIVYGPMYDRLRHNVRDLHPALDAWMVVEGYGKVLGRPGLDLARRELCIVAACAATAQDRQLHSHLHGALNVGVPVEVVRAAIEALAELLGPDRMRTIALLLARVARQ
jgi:4-carboxymuconolactone decarboxylase